MRDGGEGLILSEKPHLPACSPLPTGPCRVLSTLATLEIVPAPLSSPHPTRVSRDCLSVRRLPYARLAVSSRFSRGSNRGLDGFWWVFGRSSWWCAVHGVPQDVADWSCAVPQRIVAAALLSMGASRGILAAAPISFVGDRRDASRWCHRARALVATPWTVFIGDAADRPSPRKIGYHC